jgi:endonuclease YncB( thermonuclease family)
MWTIIGVSWLFALLAGPGVVSPPAAAAERAARVIDGDTIQLEDGQKVRYAGINAPEDGQRYFQESTQANNDLVGGKDVTLEFGRRQREKYERLLAYVFVGETFVQGELVRRGLAIVTRTQPLPRYRSVLQGYQEEARTAGRGIWAKGEHRGQLVVKEVHPREAGKKDPNDEYVVFANVSQMPLDLTGWSVTDESSQPPYIVPHFVLDVGRAFTLFTGSGKMTTDSLYWGRRKVVWNRGGDTVIVRVANGDYVLSHTYCVKGRPCR